jgi:hypothetical protein
MATALASRLPAAKPQPQTSAIAAEREEEWRVA